MTGKSFLFCLTGIFAGLICGFWLANAASRGETARISVVNESRISAPPASGTPAQSVERPQAQSSESRLSRQEIQNALERANDEPNDLNLQRAVALSLYKYARGEGEIEFLPEIKILLERSNRLQKNDFEVLAALGDVSFVLGRERNDPRSLSEARSFYQNALKLKPADAETRTNLGLTYLSAQPADARRAASEFAQVLKQKPGDETALQNLIQALLSADQTAEAEARLAELKKLNPQNAVLADLEIRLAQAKLKPAVTPANR